MADWAWERRIDSHRVIGSSGDRVIGWFAAVTAAEWPRADDRRRFQMDRDSIVRMFDARAAGYGASNWHLRHAERVVELASLRKGDRVLDAGTGTGFAAIAASQVVGPNGSIVGVDISPGMLGEAERIADERGVSNVRFVQADATRLPQPERTFDIVLCVTALFYMPIEQALREWKRVLKPGGRVIFSSVREGFPRAAALFRKCAVDFGFHFQDPANLLGNEERCRGALRDAGFVVENVFSEPLTLSPQDLNAAWEAHILTPTYSAVHDLPANELAEFKSRFTSLLKHGDDLNIMDMLFAFGKKPESD